MKLYINVKSQRNHAIQMFNYYENGRAISYSMNDLRDIYSDDINKEEYQTFDIWLEEMEKMQILNRA